MRLVHIFTGSTTVSQRLATGDDKSELFGLTMHNVVLAGRHTDTLEVINRYLMSHFMTPYIPGARDARHTLCSIRILRPHPGRLHDEPA